MSNSEEKGLFDLSGKVALVTGASRGIGRELALGLARQGADVAINYAAAKDRADAVVAEIEAMGRRAIAIKADVSVQADADRLIDQTVAGLGQIDILVNNAGIVMPANAEDQPFADWRRTMEVNLDGVFLVSQAAGRRMIAAGGGSIISIGSMSGQIVNWPFRHAAYNVSKAGVHMLTKALATEWAEHGIRVNAIAPGYIRTELTDEVLKEHPDVVRDHWAMGAVQNRIGETKELVSTCIYLAADSSGFTTGEIITVDGGLTLR